MTLYDRIMDKRKPKLDETTQAYADAFVESVNNLQNKLNQEINLNKQINDYKEALDEWLVDKLTKRNTIRIQLSQLEAQFGTDDTFIDTRYLEDVLQNPIDDPIIKRINQQAAKSSNKCECSVDMKTDTINLKFPVDYIDVTYQSIYKDNYDRKFIDGAHYLTKGALITLTINKSRYIAYLRNQKLTVDAATIDGAPHIYISTESNSETLKTIEDFGIVPLDSDEVYKKQQDDFDKFINRNSNNPFA